MPSNPTRLLLPALLLAAAIAHADTATLDAVADTSLFSFAPGNNLGALASLPVGGIKNAGNEGRILLRFAPSRSIPANAVVTNATLQLSVAKESPGSGALAVEVHRMNVAWTEGAGVSGTQGDVAKPGEPSWSSRAKGAASWATPGAGSGTDYVAAASATVSLDNPGTKASASGAALAADVQAWVSDPASDRGWILVARAPLASGTAKRLSSRESGAAGPRLVVGYTVPAGPEPPKFASAAPSGDAFEIRFHGEAGFIYEVQYQDDLGPGAWTTLGSFVVKLVPRDVVASDPLRPGGRYYRLAITGTVD